MKGKLIGIFGSAVVASLSLTAAAAGGADAQGHNMMHDHAMMDHSMHQRAAQESVVRSTASYKVPDVAMTTEEGETIHLREVLDQGTVMVNFIYTSCTTVCPAMSAAFSEVQSQLAEKNAVRMISISIDPEYDTSARLEEYAVRFHAGDNWRFLTGSIEDSVAVQRAFDAYRGNKMNHRPLTLLRAAPGSHWVRFDGFASAAQLVAEIRQLPSVSAQR